MAQSELLPTGSGTHTQGADGAGTLPTNVQTNDDATSFRRIVSGAVAQRDSYYVDALPSSAVAVTQVDVWVRVRKNNGTNRAYGSWHLSGSDLNTTSFASAGGGWTTISETSIARPGGGSWTTADFPGGSAGAEVGLMDWQSDATGSSDITKGSLTVTYTVAAGGFAFLLAQWLPPLLTVASHALSSFDIRLALSNFSWLRHMPSNREDFEKIKEALVVRPVYV